jgi:hypothetical protein
MDLSFKLRKAREHPLQALPASGQILDAGRSDEAGGAGDRSGRRRRCAGNSIKSILPRRTNVKIRARLAQLY